ncbi:MAG TPA: phosphate ABC transporter permease PtsA [Deltaproteobacteria bacterium]|nr:phosphate ABC transporter permease PtsA [Deltaproteobacteria bacterium]
MTWLCAGTLALNLLLITGLLALLASEGLSYFWQKPLWLLELADGKRALGELYETENMPDPRVGEAPGMRVRVKVGNRDVSGSDFRWIDEAQITARSRPKDAVVLERLEWGNFYGFLRELRANGQPLAQGEDAVWSRLGSLLREKARERRALEAVEKGELGRINYALERLRLERRKLALESLPAAERTLREQELSREEAKQQAAYAGVAARIEEKRAAFVAETLVVETADGAKRELPVGYVMRAIRPNALGIAGVAKLYLSRIGEFIGGDPRESNTEGGIFPAIFGTVMMVFLMSIFVAPFGVIAAVYLREYAKGGVLVRLVRIAVNNLAGVPSIVFGVFGLGFFVYLVGGTIDRLFYPEALPTPTFGTGGILWASLTLALLTVPVVIVATEEGLAAVPQIAREGSLALGATQFETLWRVVLPAAAPGILTGMILALARAAGEVAPLMIVGMVKLAPALPIDGNFPYVHLERKFMHLGFHIYDVGFQSPNVEAAKPLVFATALLLIAVVLASNLVAILVRNHLREKYATRSI